MKKRIFLSLAILLAMGNISIFSQNAEKFLEELTTSQWKAKSPANVVSMRDGERFAYVSDNKKQIIVDYYKSSKPEVIFDVDKVEKSPVKQVEWFQFDDSEGRILLLTNSRPVYRRSSISSYYVYDINRRRITPVSENGAQTSATFSPNGRIVAFARDNNLFLKKLDFDTESQITKDGKKNELINGIADWVYEEEFANVQYFQFSPDNKLLAFVKFYEKDVENFSMQLFTDTMPVFQTFKYPRAGTNNSRVSVWVYDVENRTTTRMKMEGTDFYIPIIKWTSSSDALAVVKLARDQKQIDIINYNPRSGLGATLYSESSKTYVDYRNYNAMFTSDNSFLIMSEKDGYRHIYLHSPTGIQKQQITSGNFDVVNFYGYDEASKTAYFQAAFHTPTEREVCRSVNGKISALDNRKGFQSAKFSANFKYAIYNFSNIMTPNIYSVINNSGKILRVIEDNKELADRFKKSNLPGKRFFKFTNSEGTELNGWILEPVGVSKSGKMPLVLTQYSGPDSQEVLNRWGCDWEYYLALNGFAVACVDSRGTGGRGNAFRTATYGQLGVLEAKDQIDAANYLKRNEFPNSEIGIWGWSYGGFMTLKCMISDNSPFKAGVAIAPVTDWKLYNTAYTERFMNRPQENYDGYEKANLLKQADKLKGSLLMIHGTADDNVHTQNTYLMAEQLVDAGIQFDMQLYTNKNHSILGSKARYNLYKRCMEFFGAKLK